MPTETGTERLYGAVRSFVAGGVVGGAEGDGLIWCGEVARGGCVFAWNISVTRPTVLTGTEKRASPDMLSLPQ